MGGLTNGLVRWCLAVPLNQIEATASNVRKKCYVIGPLYGSSASTNGTQNQLALLFINEPAGAAGSPMNFGLFAPLSVIAFCWSRYGVPYRR
jgi:hypothetical protein